MLRTVNEVISELGGPTAVAAKIGLGKTAVGNWKMRGSIPAEHFLSISILLSERRLKADPVVFGFRAPEQAGA